ncbi:MAG TPA: anti-sigma factor [Nitrospirales bacterium]|jgi:anti-sigma-K factor RskA
MSLEQFEEAVALYAVDALEPHEREALEAHVRAGCEECRAALTEYQSAAGLLPYALPPEPVPFDLQTHLMRTFQLDFAKQGEPVPLSKVPLRDRFLNWWGPFGRPAFAVASVLLILGIGTYAVTLRSQLQNEAAQRRQIETAMQNESARLAALQVQAADQEQQLIRIRTQLADTLGTTRDTLAAREAELDELRARVAQQKEPGALGKTVRTDDEMAALLRGPNTRVVSLSGSDEAKSAGGLLLFDPSTKRAFLYAFNMPALPSGKIYQLWAIVDKPISAGTFGTEAGNKSRVFIQRMPDLTHTKKFAVTMEPEGGRSQPTGPILLSGPV